MNAPAKIQQLQMQRFIRAPREKVFDAFVTVEALELWKAPYGMTVPQARIDAREGGEWQLSMQAPDGARLELGGVYRELRRPERLVYTFCWQGGSGPMPGVETLVEVDFIEAVGGTELRLRHTGFVDPAQLAGHGQGWDSSLNQLAELFRAPGSNTTPPRG